VEISDSPHRRLNALTGEWVLVSPHRMKRPWQGKVEETPLDERPSYDPTCYLCPGNQRAGGLRNPNYESTYVFTNDFASLLPDTELITKTDLHDLMRTDSVRGTCRVICFSPRHNLTLAEMQSGDIRKVVEVWTDQVEELGREYRWVQVFENKGDIMGCSNPHPHGQIWAGSSLPNEPEKEDRRQRDFFDRHRSILLLDYLAEEVESGERIIVQNQHWIVLVPFWGVWPFETLLVPKNHRPRLTDLSDEERDSLADIMKQHLVRYDNLFRCSFPYTMGWHGAPHDYANYEYWQLHAHYYPPLLRSAMIKKYMVGYEMLSEPQRDLTPEQVAVRLRGLSEKHYKEEIG